MESQLPSDFIKFFNYTKSHADGLHVVKGDSVQLQLLINFSNEFKSLVSMLLIVYFELIRVININAKW